MLQIKLTKLLQKALLQTGYFDGELVRYFIYFSLQQKPVDCKSPRSPCFCISAVTAFFILREIFLFPSPGFHHAQGCKVTPGKKEIKTLKNILCFLWTTNIWIKGHE